MFSMLRAEYKNISATPSDAVRQPYFFEIRANVRQQYVILLESSDATFHRQISGGTYAATFFEHVVGANVVIDR